MREGAGRIVRRIGRSALAPRRPNRASTDVRTAPKPRLRVERPRLYKVVLLNDDYTPRDFVVRVLRQVFRIGTDQAHVLMMTAHRRGVCVIAVFTREVAESKADEATGLGRRAGFPLRFTMEPET